MESIENIAFSSDDFEHDFQGLLRHISRKLPMYNFDLVQFDHFQKFLFRGSISSESRDSVYSKTT